jgi:DNA-binding SARP family transcriptional activator
MIEAYCDHTLGLCALQAGDLAEARACFERARVTGEELGEPSLRTLPRIGLAEVSLAEGNAHAALTLASEGLALARERRDLFQEAECRTLLGLACSRRQKKARTLHWKRAEKLYRTVGASFGLHRLLLLRLDAEGAGATGDGRALRELLSGAARLDHLFLFEKLFPERAARVLPRAVEAGVEAAFASRILERIGAPAVPGVSPLLESASEETREAAIRILGRIGGEEARRLLEPLADRKTRAGRAAIRAARALEGRDGGGMNIRALGSFRLEIDGAEVPAERWRSGRAARLLKLLLVNRFQWVPRDAAIEALWPEADPEVTESNLRQSVFLLRRILGSAAGTTGGSRFVQALGEAYRLDPGPDYEYDVERFETAVRKASALSGPETREEKKAALADAIALYRGAFLEESPFEEFLVLEREKLRERFVWALGKRIEMSGADGAWEEVVPLCRRGLAEDPYAESFHAGLVRSLLELGHRAEAIEAWSRYEKQVCRELGVEPSEAMRTLGDRLSRK